MISAHDAARRWHTHWQTIADWNDAYGNASDNPSWWQTRDCGYANERNLQHYIQHPTRDCCNLVRCSTLIVPCTLASISKAIDHFMHDWAEASRILSSTRWPVVAASDGQAMQAQLLVPLNLRNFTHTYYYLVFMNWTMQQQVFHVDERLQIGSERATVRYIGRVSGQSGEWVGLEWDNELRGKHDGSVKGQRYFECKYAGMWPRHVVGSASAADLCIGKTSAEMHTHRQRGLLRSLGEAAADGTRRDQRAAGPVRTISACHGCSRRLTIRAGWGKRSERAPSTATTAGEGLAVWRCSLLAGAHSKAVGASCTCKCNTHAAGSCSAMSTCRLSGCAVLEIRFPVGLCTIALHDELLMCDRALMGSSQRQRQR